MGLVSSDQMLYNDTTIFHMRHRNICNHISISTSQVKYSKMVPQSWFILLFWFADGRRLISGNGHFGLNSAHAQSLLPWAPWMVIIIIQLKNLYLWRENGRCCLMVFEMLAVWWCFVSFLLLDGWHGVINWPELVLDTLRRRCSHFLVLCCCLAGA